MHTTQELQQELNQHYGSESVFRHALVRNVCYTEGVQAFAQHAGGGAYWLLDILATEPAILRLARAEGIAFATLAVKDGKAVLSVAADSGVPPVFSQVIPYTDCPDGDWLFYLQPTEVVGQEVIMILLPSEY